MSQHLTKEKRIQIGSFYTPQKLVGITYNLITKNNLKFDFILDTSAGYGDFIKKEYSNKFICVDIDQKALNICKEKHSDVLRFINANSLLSLDRKKLKIKKESKLLIYRKSTLQQCYTFL